MRHRISLISTGLVVGLIACSIGAANAQDLTTPKVNPKTLQKQCLALAQRDTTKGNANMAAPAPVVSDSLRAVCDSVNAANPSFKHQAQGKAKSSYPEPIQPADSMGKAKSSYPEPIQPADSMPVKHDTTSMSPSATAIPSTGAIPAAPATPADPTKPKDGASSTTTPH